VSFQSGKRQSVSPVAGSTDDSVLPATAGPSQREASCHQEADNACQIPAGYAAALAAWRSGLMRTTSQARPSFSSAQITPAVGSSCLAFIPWTAEVGKAWWLLCQASPKVGSASHARLRDSSVVSKSRLPNMWQSELIE